MLTKQEGEYVSGHWETESPDRGGRRGAVGKKYRKKRETRETQGRRRGISGESQQRFCPLRNARQNRDTSHFTWP